VKQDTNAHVPCGSLRSPFASLALRFARPSLRSPFALLALLPTRSLVSLELFLKVCGVAMCLVTVAVGIFKAEISSTFDAIPSDDEDDELDAADIGIKEVRREGEIEEHQIADKSLEASRGTRKPPFLHFAHHNSSTRPNKSTNAIDLRSSHRRPTPGLSSAAASRPSAGSCSCS
jgi:hypothetical protein